MKQNKKPKLSLNHVCSNNVNRQLVSSELGSSEESGKDWSDLEREAAEADRERNDFEDEYTKQKKKGGGSYRDKYDGKR